MDPGPERRGAVLSGSPAASVQGGHPTIKDSQNHFPRFFSVVAGVKILPAHDTVQDAVVKVA